MHDNRDYRSPRHYEDKQQEERDIEEMEDRDRKKLISLFGWHRNGILHMHTTDEVQLL